MQIPENWKTYSLEQVTEPIAGASPKDTPKRFFKYIDIGSIDPAYGIVKDVKEFRGDKAPSRARRLVKTGDILFSTVRTYLRKVATVPSELDGQFASTGLAVLRARRGLVPDYLFHWVRSKRFIDEMTEAQTGALYPALRDSTLQSSLIPVAPTAEQISISNALNEVLSTANVLRARLSDAESLIRHTREHILKMAFDGKLITGKASHRIKSTDWQQGVFADLASIDTSLVNPRDHQMVAHIAPNNIESGTGKLLPFETISEAGVKSGKNKFHAGQVLYSKIRPQLRKAVHVDFAGLCSADMYPLTPRGDAKYLLYWLLSPQFNMHVKHRDGRTVLPKINRAELSAIPTPIPPLSEQKIIAAAIDSAFSQLERSSTLILAAQASISQLEDEASAKAFSGRLVRNDPTLQATSFSEQLQKHILHTSPSDLSQDERRNMARPDEQLATDISKWPANGLTFEEIADRLSGEYDELRDAIFSALSGDSPILTQVFDEKIGAIRLKRRSA